MTDVDLERYRVIGEQLRRPSLAQVLAAHWLVTVGCSHDTNTDSPVCSCSLVNLGTHQSIGDAVKAWSEHVEDEVRKVRGGCA